jgi:cobalt-zinc-cadmium efflux system outer membrane protein
MLFQSLRSVRRSGYAMACLLAIASAHVRADETLTLPQAIARVAASYPELRLVDARLATLDAERAQAALKPAWAIGAQIENALGSGSASGFKEAELTLSLASMLEGSGKLDARRTLAQARYDAQAVQRETTRLDMLAEVARRYLAVVGTDRSIELAALDVAQRKRAVDAARFRYTAGAAPESVLLTAQAALARAELRHERIAQQCIGARLHLAALWGERQPAFAISGDALQLPAIGDIDTLATLLASSPELAQFADEQRIREARVQLAQSAQHGDLEWQVGVRRLQAPGDVAFVGGLSLPLGARARAQPEIRAAQADLAALQIEREAKDMALYSTLAEAQGRYSVDRNEVMRLASDVLPRLARAEQAAERAYRGGAISYLEWSQLQAEQTATRQQQLDTALDAQRALIEIQRLTGQPWVLSTDASPAGAAR